MLKLLGSGIKLVIFSLLVLILGNWLHWDGRTISDQVKMGMSHAEESSVVHSLRSWAQKITLNAREGEEITTSERQKLKALIKELNSSHK
jgi:hypothetical protein